MSIEMWFINNSNNALSWYNKTVEIGFILYCSDKNKDELRNSRALMQRCFRKKEAAFKYNTDWLRNFICNVSYFQLPIQVFIQNYS